MRWRHAIIVGASSGIGMEIARQLAEQGTRVAVLARREEPLTALAAAFPDQVLPFVHDVRNTGDVPELFGEVTRALGGLELFVYAAGVMPAVQPDEFDFEKDQAIVETNVVGAMAWLDQAATRFQAVGSGTIVGIGSVAGDRGRAGQPAYNASKAALATFLEALRNRLDRKGVTVVTVKPGPVATDMTAGLNLKGAMPVDRAAAHILRKSRHPGEHYLSPVHRILFAAIRAVPGWLFRRIGPP
ncbi:MAG: SDR family NAD(P)-dependent oxidoreductase [Fimbriimonadales bacterium]